MRRLVLGLSLMLATLAFACGGGRTGSAAKMPDGSPIAVMVNFNRNITPDMPPERAEQVNQLATWMEDDLLAILSKTGYAATRVEDPGIQAGPGRYVLRVAIREYNAGSKAARMLVGFGAGAAKLDTHFELVGDGAVAMVAGDPSVATGRDWRNAARKVNLQTVDTVNAALHKR
jgi:hypothetical protein